MVVSLKHKYVSAKADGPDPTLVNSSNWNDEHNITLAASRLLGRATASAGAVEEISIDTSLKFTGTVLGADLTKFGTVTSIQVSGGTTGLTTSGGPVTTTGTITLAGVLGIANGGTGAATKTLAFNALSPTTTRGDIIARAVTDDVRLPLGASGTVLTSNGVDAVWAAVTVGTVTSVAMSGGTTGLTFSGGPITTTGTFTAAGTLALANGGTGQVTKTAAFDALSPTTTRGDLIVQGATNDQRLAVGTSGQFLSSNGTDPIWAAITGFVPTSRQIITGAGINGGGPMTADITLTFNIPGLPEATLPFSGPNYLPIWNSAQGNCKIQRDPFYDTFKLVPQERTITPGVGLERSAANTGPIDLQQDITIQMGQPSTITATSTNNRTATSHNHQIDNLAVASAGNAAMGGATLGAWAMLRWNGTANFANGSRTAGTNLVYSNAAGGAPGAASPAGSWQAMANMQDTTVGNPQATGIFLRYL